MKLLDLDKNDKAYVVKIDSDDLLKERLNSFGISKNSVLSIQAYSTRKKTIEILVEGTLIALRDKEASQIIVEKLVKD
jgi:ferrous iron transport protein A